MPSVSVDSVWTALLISWAFLAISGIIWAVLTPLKDHSVILMSIFFYPAYLYGIWLVCFSIILVFRMAIKSLCACLSWQWIVSAPRGRQGDSDERYDLCMMCQRFLQQSCLLVGTKKIFTPTTEWHDFYSTVQEMESLRLSCRLCDILLSYPPEQNPEPALLPPNLDYDSIY